MLSLYFDGKILSLKYDVGIDDREIKYFYYTKKDSTLYIVYTINTYIQIAQREASPYGVYDFFYNTVKFLLFGYFIHT